MVVVEVAEAGDALGVFVRSGERRLEAIPVEPAAQEIPDRLGPVLVAFSLTIVIEIGQKIFVQRYCEPFHRALPFPPPPDFGKR